MESLFIKGGHTLSGSLDVASSKNALLPILAGSVMVNGEVRVKNSTMYTDVSYMTKILTEIGCKTLENGEDIYIDSKNIDKFFVKEEYTKMVRSSIFMLGPLLSRLKKAVVAYPGGCNIGNRPIDLH